MTLNYPSRNEDAQKCWLKSTHFWLDILAYSNSMFGFKRPIEPKETYRTIQFVVHVTVESQFRIDSESVPREAASIANT